MDASRTDEPSEIFYVPEMLIHESEGNVAATNAPAPAPVSSIIMRS